MLDFNSNEEVFTYLEGFWFGFLQQNYPVEETE